MRLRQPTRRIERRVHAPFGHPARRIQRRRTAGLGQELGHIETDAAGADDRHPAADIDPAFQHIQIADDAGVVCARDIQPAWSDAGGNHHFVEPFQRIRVHAGVQAQVHAGLFDAVAEIAQRFVEFLRCRVTALGPG